MEKIVLHVEAAVNPTESPEKVRVAVENIFGNVQTVTHQTSSGSRLVAESESMDALTWFCNLLRRERIRAAAKKVFYDGLDGKAIGFCLNKQVAFAGHISFSKEAGESPLGPIRVRLETENPRRLIDWLTSMDV
jgi:predicted RNA binding protein with dsRBD fold (UPF0201 family)